MTRRLRNPYAAILALVLWPAVAMGQVTLTELGAANAARNDLMANGGKPADAAAAGAAPQAAAPKSVTPSVGFGGMKYVLSYALVGMLLGLGMYLVCRPANRHEAA
jgi:hypothetical protein